MKHLNIYQPTFPRYVFMLLATLGTSNSEPASLPLDLNINSEVTAMVIWKINSPSYQLIITNKGKNEIRVNGASLTVNSESGKRMEDRSSGFAPALKIKPGLSKEMVIKPMVDEENGRAVPRVQKFELTFTLEGIEKLFTVTKCDLYICGP